MGHRFVRLIQPHGSPQGDLATASVYKIPFTKKDMTIYDTVDFFKQEIFPKTGKTGEQEEVAAGEVLLREIINLHNDTGIRDVSQITTMTHEIKSGKDILSTSGVPNIKLVSAHDDEWVLFDGHHTLLAYMASGKNYLDDVPHIIIQSETGHVKDNEILVFFGVHSKKLKASDWREYMINWQLPEEKQLCKRVQKNMGELLDSLRNKASDNLAIR